MAKNTRAKTVDRKHAYECRLIDGQPAWALKYYQSQSNPNPYARVKVSRGDDLVGHDMYVQIYQGYQLIDNPLAPKPVVVDADQLEFTDFVYIACCLDEPRTSYEQMIDEEMRKAGC